MKFTQEIEKSQAKKFIEKFPIKLNKSYIIKSQDGKIISVKTNDKDIIAYCKKLGLK
jgi:hypothetical protein